MFLARQYAQKMRTCTNNLKSLQRALSKASTTLMLSARSNCRTSRPNTDTATRLRLFTSTRASRVKIPSVLFQAPQILGCQSSRLSPAAGTSGKPGRSSHPASCKAALAAAERTFHSSLSAFLSKPAAVSALSRALCPSARLKRDLSNTRPTAATLALGHLAVLTPYPTSLASEADTRSFQGRAQSATRKGMSPAKQRSSSTTDGHSRTTQS
jgi:hypothetical protein